MINNGKLMRKLMRKLILAFYVMSFVTGCQTLSDLDRALYSTTDKVTTRDNVTGGRELTFGSSPKLSLKADEDIKKIIKKIRAKGGRVNEALDRTAFLRLERVTKRVHVVSHLKNRALQPVLIPVKGFNAFVNGGHYVVVNKGLMDYIASDDELAAVIGHEIAHLAANHGNERMGIAMAGRLSGSKNVSKEGRTSAYSRVDELEADRIGVLYMALAGFNPSASSELWDRKNIEQGSNDSLYAGHPRSSERTRRNAEAAIKVSQYYTKGVQHPNHDSVLNNNTLWKKRHKAVKAGSGGGVIALLDTVSNGYKKKSEARLEQAKAKNRNYKIESLRSSLQKVKLQRSRNGRALRIWLKNSGPSIFASSVTFRVSYPGDYGSKEITNRVTHKGLVPGYRNFHIDFRPYAIPSGLNINNIKISVDDIIL